MPISGVVILTKADKTKQVLGALEKQQDVTTYGVHKDYYIVAVFEADTSGQLEAMSRDIQTNIPGVIGIYPAYVNFENEINKSNDD